MRKSKSPPSVLGPALLPLGCLALWQGAAMVLRHPLFPTPMEALLSGRDCWPSLSAHMLASLARLLGGLALALLAGLPLGLLLGLSQRADRCLSGLFYLSGPLPKAALLPLLLLAFGVGDSSKIALIFLVLFFPLTLGMRDAVREIPPVFYAPYDAAGLGFFPKLRDVTLPACLPALFTALRNGLTAGVSILFLAETYGTQLGMGFFIMDMWIRLDYAKMLLGIALFGGLGFLLCRLTDLLEARLIHS
ncbi:MAG: ABC transporter permease subunit [Clostridiales bacterium]|nr:ABC transporter permease subunit [Clostridiales bacterium]